ncbi:MAG: hypothetical protein JXR96_19000 [Deltaproteobacteria bacterium]|nr:hypothetical protein [Deltaproteobacteria bacterium]
MLSDAVSDSFSHLVPLLVLLGVVFVVIIGLAVALRIRVQRQRGAPARARGEAAQSVLDVQRGDRLSVLGRGFALAGVQRLMLDTGEALWCDLEHEEGPARLLLRCDRSEAVYLPGWAEQAPEGSPERIERGEGLYEQRETIEIQPGWSLALYAHQSGRQLALERRAERITLWRGKGVPFEGVLRDERPGPMEEGPRSG